MTLPFGFVKVEGFFSGSRGRCIRVPQPLNCRALAKSHDMTSLDYYKIEELLTDEERSIRDRVAQFVQKEVLSEVVSCFRAAKFPDHLIPRMGALRFYAPYLKEHGCAGVSYTGYGLIMQELERACNSGDPFLRLAGATRAVVARVGVRRARGLLRPNGTWTRLRPGRDGDSSQTRRRSLHFERQ